MPSLEELFGIGTEHIDDFSPPTVDVVVYKNTSLSKVIAKAWDDKHGRWRRIAQGKAGTDTDNQGDDAKVVDSLKDYDFRNLIISCDLYGNFNLGNSFGNNLTVFFLGTIYGSITLIEDRTKIIGGSIINKTESQAVSILRRNCSVERVYIESKYDGITLDISDEDEPALENRVEDCKIVCMPSSLWTYGIIERAKNTDNFYLNNIINGFTAGISLAGGGSLVQGNHIYRLPADKYYCGIIIKAYKTRCFNNYIDNCSGVCFYIPQTVGLVHICNNICTIYSNNPGYFIQIGDNAYPETLVIKGNIVKNVSDSQSPFEYKLGNCIRLICSDNICDNITGVRYTENTVKEIDLGMTPGNGDFGTPVRQTFVRPLSFISILTLSYSVAAGDTLYVDVYFVFEDGSVSTDAYTITVDNSAGTSTITGNKYVNSSNMFVMVQSDIGKRIVGLEASAKSETGATTSQQNLYGWCLTDSPT